MRGAIVLLLIALGMAGCKNQPPTADPFINHPIVPPPATGACPAPTTDPGYSPLLQPGQPQPVRPGSPVNNFGQPAPGTPSPTYPNAVSAPGGTTSGGWTVPGSAVQKPVAPSTISAPAGSTAGSPTLGATTPYLIPPPPTAVPGGYPNLSTNPQPTTPGPATAPFDNRFGPSGGTGTLQGAPLPSNSPILGTPRPTPSQATNRLARPAAAIPSTASFDYRNSPHPVDDTAQPIRSPSPPSMNNPANAASNLNSMPVANRPAPRASLPAQQGLAAAPAAQPRTMPMPPTAYGSPLAAPPYISSIQTIVVEPNWQPCDGYADDGE